MKDLTLSPFVEKEGVFKWEGGAGRATTRAQP
jgi:hypothetical protein